MTFFRVVMVGLALSACSPAPPTVKQNPTAQQTPSPSKQKMVQLNNTGWAP
jgi:hypothetical protein